ncbi:HD domain-containing protein [Kribbella speibonae]|uniref:HD domain-containing protein n=1 Tax=Kribbella speibonae TaxID=1572660 RepID=A0ABY2A9E6_9ACTN|nr:HD domain-containing protein [Kribbella speibonae]
MLFTVRSSEPAAIAKHSLRSFFFAQLVATREGCLADAAYDRELLFAATVLHDLGAGDLAEGKARFEVEGADLAAGLLREHGMDEADVDLVWEAIALHTSAGIAERRGLLAYLTRAGVGVDFGGSVDVAAERHEEIHAEYPRLGMARVLVDAIVERAAASPPYTLGAELLRERQTNGITRIEQAAAAGAWGE